jgi:hypothetical protein
LRGQRHPDTRLRWSGRASYQKRHESPSQGYQGWEARRRLCEIAYRSMGGSLWSVCPCIATVRLSLGHPRSRCENETKPRKQPRETIPAALSVVRGRSGCHAALVLVEMFHHSALTRAR